MKFMKSKLIKKMNILTCSFCPGIFFIWFKNNNLFKTSAGKKGDQKAKRIEYILERNLANSSVWILLVPFSLKGTTKCTIQVIVHKLYAVHYTNTVWSMDISIPISWFYKVV